MSEQVTFKEAMDRAIALHQCGELETAELIYIELLNYAPEHIDILHLKGVLSNQKKEFKVAIELINKALSFIPTEYQNHPAFSIFHQNLANAYLQDGQSENAEKSYKKSLELNPDNVDTKYNYSRLLSKLGRYDEALEQLDELLKITPTYINAELQKGEIFFEIGEHKKAKKQFEMKLEIDTHDLDARMLIGKSCLELNQLEEAYEHFEKASKLGTNLYEPYFWLGFICTKTFNIKKASEFYDVVLYINPNYVPALVNTTSVSLTLGESQKALNYAKKALQLENSFNTNSNLSNVFGYMKQYGEALHYAQVANSLNSSVSSLINMGKITEFTNKIVAKEAYENAIKIEPSSLEALSSLLALKMDIFEYTGMEELKDKIVGIAEETDGDGLNPFDTCTKFQFITQEKRKKYLEKNCEKQFSTITEVNKNRYTYDKIEQGRRLRIGFLSADYKNQATMHLACGIFEYFNKNNFEVFAIALDLDESSYYYKRVLESVEHFINFKNKNYLDIADEINNLKIDILIDLNSHSNGAKMEVLALKPSPIQITYLYHPSTSGANFMDYCIVDNIAVPEIEQDFFTEKLIYMPKCYQPNDAKQPVSDKIFTRNELGFENDDFIFCSFNATWKIDIKIFTSWIKILNMVPNAKIWLMYSSDEATNNIINFVNSKGIDASRIVFANSMNKDEHLARLKIADLFLDTTYCNAHTTASDALFAGVPVLTIKGNSFATRVAESLLINIGLDDMVVDSEEDYVNKAIYLSTNKNELDDIKKRLQQNKNVFPLFDTVGFAKDLEALLKTVI